MQDSLVLLPIDNNINLYSYKDYVFWHHFIPICLYSRAKGIPLPLLLWP